MLITPFAAVARLRGPRLYRSARDKTICGIPSLRSWFLASPDWYQSLPNVGPVWRDRITGADFYAPLAGPKFDETATYPRLLFQDDTGRLHPRSEELRLSKKGWTVAFVFSADFLDNFALFGTVPNWADSSTDIQPILLSNSGTLFLNYHQSGSFVLGTNSVGGVTLNTLQITLISWSPANGVNFSTNGILLPRQVNNVIAAYTDTRIQIGYDDTVSPYVFRGKIYELKLFDADLHDAAHAGDFTILLNSDKAAYGL